MDLPGLARFSRPARLWFSAEAGAAAGRRCRQSPLEVPAAAVTVAA